MLKSDKDGITTWSSPEPGPEADTPEAKAKALRVLGDILEHARAGGVSVSIPPFRSVDDALERERLLKGLTPTPAVQAASRVPKTSPVHKKTSSVRLRITRGKRKRGEYGATRDRRRIIRSVERAVPYPEYCTMVHQRGLRPVWPNCPPTYPAMWDSGKEKFRKLIRDERRNAWRANPHA